MVIPKTGVHFRVACPAIPEGLQICWSTNNGEQEEEAVDTHWVRVKGAATPLTVHSSALETWLKTLSYMEKTAVDEVNAHRHLPRWPTFDAWGVETTWIVLGLTPLALVRL